MEISKNRQQFAAAVKAVGLPKENVGGFRSVAGISKDGIAKVATVLEDYSKQIKKQIAEMNTPKELLELLYRQMSNAFEQTDVEAFLKKVKGSEFPLAELAKVYVRNVDGVLVNLDTIAAAAKEGNDRHNRFLLQAKYLAQTSSPSLKKDEKQKIIDPYSKYVIQAILADWANINLLNPVRHHKFFDFESFSFITFDKWKSKFKYFLEHVPISKDAYNTTIKELLIELNFLLKHMDSQLLVIQVSGKVTQEW